MSKKELVESVLEAAKEQSAATVFFHMAMAEATGLCPSDHKALDMIMRRDGMTAGELSTETGLATASVTSLIDRLEERGYVRRVRGTRDRRRIKVEAVKDKIHEIRHQFVPLKMAASKRLNSFTESELETIRSYLRLSSELVRGEAVRLAEENGGIKDKPCS